MPRTNRPPAYRLHKARDLAVVTLAGKDHYLGPYGSPESHERYARLIADWHASGHRPPAAPSAPAGPTSAPCPSPATVNEVILAFWEHAKKHYRHADGTPTRELDNYRDALRPLRKLFGRTRASEFGPLRLRAVREEMLRADLCRKTINARVHRLRRVFRWAVSEELIPASVGQALGTVASLQRGRCDARESDGVRPVDWEHVEATLPHLPRSVAAMVQVMRYANCRAEDVVTMRGCDLTMRGEVWEYRPASHKNQWREEHSPIHKRVVCLGPRCQEIARRFLKADLLAYLFSPRESRAEYQTRRAAARKSKRTPSELRRRRKARPRRAPGDRYTVNTFQQAIRKTCRKVGVPGWTVLQVRHTRATEVREQYGLEGAAASLGDTVEAAAIYAEKNRELARKIAREIG
jgi:integrase